MAAPFPAKGFERALASTLQMLRQSCKADACVFFQMGDRGELNLRAGDGRAVSRYSRLAPSAGKAPWASCLKTMRIVEVPSHHPARLEALFGRKIGGRKIVLIPVIGQQRTLGLLALGPLPAALQIHSREKELRMAGTLCAVISANWRLYEWLSRFMGEMNHELRTPLTAIQGSIGMVLGGLFGSVGGEMKAMLELAQRGCERTVKAIEEHISSKQA